MNKSYKIGQRFLNIESNDEYLLTATAAKRNVFFESYVFLTNLETGAPYYHNLKVGDVLDITEDEFKKICANNPSSFQLINTNKDNEN